MSSIFTRTTFITFSWASSPVDSNTLIGCLVDLFICIARVSASSFNRQTKTFALIGELKRRACPRFGHWRTWSTEPVATTGVVVLKAMQVTKCWWASRVFMHRPAFKSQILIVLSSDALNKNLPEGWNTSPRTQLSCPIYKREAWFKTSTKKAKQIRTICPDTYQSVNTLSCCVPEFNGLVSGSCCDVLARKGLILCCDLWLRTETKKERLSSKQYFKTCR